MSVCHGPHPRRRSLTQKDGRENCSSLKLIDLGIAMIELDDDAADRIMAQIGDCPNCLGSFGRCLGGLVSGMMIGRVGRNNARTAAQIYLDEVLNSPDLLNPPE